jgi:hypothetical protein
MKAGYCRERARALRGIPVADAKSGHAFRRTGIAAALHSRAAIAPPCYGGTARSAFFEDRFKNGCYPAFRRAAP